MKFVPQDLFEVAVLEAAKSFLTRPEAADLFLNAISGSYRENYPGDALWIQQVQSCILPTVSDAIAKEPFFPLHLLAHACTLRKELDEGLNPRTAVSRVFGGTLFSRGHPQPALRPELALSNIRSLTFGIMKSSSYTLDLNAAKRKRSIGKMRSWAFTPMGLSHKVKLLSSSVGRFEFISSPNFGVLINQFDQNNPHYADTERIVPSTEIDHEWTDASGLRHLGCPKCGGNGIRHSTGRKYRCSTCSYEFLLAFIDEDSGAKKRIEKRICLKSAG